MDVPTQAEVDAVLADARGARASLVAGGNWLRKYLLVFAAASVPVMLLIGLGGQRGAAIGTTLWMLLVVTMSWWGSRQRVILRGQKRRSVLAFGGWGALYGGTLLLGIYPFEGQPAFWVTAAVITVMPLVAGAYWPTGRGDGSGRERVRGTRNP